MEAELILLIYTKSSLQQTIIKVMSIIPKCLLNSDFCYFCPFSVVTQMNGNDTVYICLIVKCTLYHFYPLVSKSNSVNW